ncbi:hypothetical protein KSU11_01150 [Fusobacterium nucleatum]|uniref:hypothetical protein n=1 Tax=Fusobacterium nucleatum TaxID=851 RepID=UPI0030D543F5
MDKLKDNLKLNLKKYLFDSYKNLIEIKETSKRQLEISLPIFLNTGDAFDFIIEILDDKNLNLKNILYSRIENALKEYVTFYDFRKKYLLGKDKFKEIKTESLLNNGISISLDLKKTIKYSDEESLIFEIFNYSFSIIRYYNFIYDDFITRNKLDKEKKGYIFKKEIENFVENYNKNKINKLTLLNDDMLTSQNNTYYISNKELLTGVYDKIHFWESLNDFELILNKFKNNEEIKIEKIFMLYEDIPKNYIKKAIINKKNILDKIDLRDINDKQYILQI